MKVTRNSLIASAIVVALGVTLSGCSDPDAGGESAASDEPYRAVAILPVSGALASAAAVQIAGLEASIDKVNASGGIDGREVQLEVLDSKLDPTQAVSLLQEQVNGTTKPDFVWAGATSNELLAMLPVLTSAGVLSSSTAASTKANDPETYPYHFGGQATGEQNYRWLVENVVDDGFTKIGYVYTSDALGTDSFAQMERFAEEAGVELIAQSYDPAATDLTAPMDAVRAASPEVLVMQGYGAPAGYLLDARAKLGWDIPVVGDLSIGGSNIANLVDASLLEDVEVAVTVTADLSSRDDWLPNTESALEAIREKVEITQVSSQALIPFDSLQLVQLAAEQAESSSADDIKEALENLDAPAEVPWTVYREYDYSPDNHFPLLSTEDNVLVPAGPMVSGQYE